MTLYHHVGLITKLLLAEKWDVFVPPSSFHFYIVLNCARVDNDDDWYSIKTQTIIDLLACEAPHTSKSQTLAPTLSSTRRHVNVSRRVK